STHWLGSIKNVGRLKRISVRSIGVYILGYKYYSSIDVSVCSVYDMT
ncbi:MAG: hypothetical protein ACJA2O_002403, partial [Candidatus Azotimanducaceae bacterium]